LSNNPDITIDGVLSLLIAARSVPRYDGNQIYINIKNCHFQLSDRLIMRCITRIDDLNELNIIIRGFNQPSSKSTPEVVIAATKHNQLKNVKSINFKKNQRNKQFGNNKQGNNKQGNNKQVNNQNQYNQKRRNGNNKEENRDNTRKVKKSEDWICNCGESNYQTRDICRNCGAPKNNQNKKHKNTIKVIINTEIINIINKEIINQKEV